MDTNSKPMAAKAAEAQASSVQQAPYDAIFFDMDGTLLPIEVRDFLIPYYELLEAACAKEGWEPRTFREAVNTGIFSMMDHPTNETNETAFWRVFFGELFGAAAGAGGASDADGAGGSGGAGGAGGAGGGPSPAQKERLWHFFDAFYKDDFQHAGRGVVPNPASARALEVLAAKGYPLYLTTMPMFPYAAIEWRMKWAGCDIGLFSRVTTFDNSTWTKPHVEYYEENLALAGVNPARVLMVGNNTEDDLNCLKAGMDAYLITDYLINPNDFDISTVKHGSMEEFAAWVEGLPACTSTTALDWRSRADALRLGA